MLFACLGTVLLMAVSCQSDADEPQTTEQSILESQIASLGFVTEAMYEAELDGKKGVVVEGDIFLDKAMISDLLKEQQPSDDLEKHYVTPSLLPRDRAVTVDVFLDPSFSSTMRAAFNEALNRYNELNINLTFRSVSSEAASDIAILLRDIPNTPQGNVVLGRSAGFPRNGRPATPITLNSKVFGSRTPADAPTVIAHEIGHAIGFRHTDLFDRSFSCGGEPVNEQDFSNPGALFVPGTPRGPENGSWMLACSDGSDRPFTAADRTALRFVY
ncbi:Dual-action HEIGH metallo-peptidase [Aquimarina spongiae]|uniref:Dual-action HEIGH metallo-peptidase n=2 Tax=Aquimarina spongiae TaxID=570521 RepID=A0A1M6F248_9FLAO|nr:Dual-action HEIGH metallo-peptidase [Aquimarina spongiae]